MMVEESTDFNLQTNDKLRQLIKRKIEFYQRSGHPKATFWPDKANDPFEMGQQATLGSSNRCNCSEI